MFYVYVHYRPNGEPFYVGKGKGKRAYDFKDRANAHYLSIVAKHGVSNITVQLFPQIDEPTAFAKERSLIKAFRDAGYTLCNLTAGGEGPAGRVPRPESIAKMAKAQLGRKHSEETKRKMSVARSGVVCSAEARANMSKAKMGNTYGVGRKVVHTPETRAKMSATRRGKKQSVEHVTKRTAGVSARLRGNKYCAGRVMSQETRAKISATKRSKRLGLYKEVLDI